MLVKIVIIGLMLLFFLLLMVYFLCKKEKILFLWVVSNLLVVGFLGSVFKYVVGWVWLNLGVLVDWSFVSFFSGYLLLVMVLVCMILIILVYFYVEKIKGIKIFLFIYLVLIVLGCLILCVYYFSDVIVGMFLSYSWINFLF